MSVSELSESATPNVYYRQFDNVAEQGIHADVIGSTTRILGERVFPTRRALLRKLYVWCRSNDVPVRAFNADDLVLASLAHSYFDRDSAGGYRRRPGTLAALVMFAEGWRIARSRRDAALIFSGVKS